MNNFDLITHLENHLRAYISLRPLEAPPDSWSMRVRLFYDGEPAGATSFLLRGYNREEAENIARNLRSNSYLMKEIDEFLWGESD
jgi:hypothetical protein